MKFFSAIRRRFSRPQTASLGEGVGAIPTAGRSSAEEPTDILTGLSGYLDTFDGISPIIPVDYLEFLVKVAAVNPDISHAVKNWVNLANNGHEIIVDSASDRVMDMAHERLNMQARRLYRRSGGVDGLINHYLYDLAVSGAISSEDVLEADFSGVRKVAIVPARKIRFKMAEEDYEPYQRLRDGTMLPLNEETYCYFAYQVIENSPYAKPTILAAIEPILRQRDMHENINFVMKKFGILGLTALTLSPPPREPNESTEEWRRRSERYMSDVVTAMKKNYREGLMVKMKDQDLEHHNVAGNAQNANQLYVLNEEQVASGIGVDSSILGRSYHATESFANVMYMFMIRDSNSLRRLVKRRMERTYWLDLILSGVPIDGVSMVFNPNPARDPQSEAQAEQTKQKTVLERVQLGLIDPDTAAQELGYHEWHDPSKIGFSLPEAARAEEGARVRFTYNRTRHLYEFVRPRVLLSTAQQRKSEFAIMDDDEARQIVRRLADDYLRAITPFHADARESAIDDILRFLRRHSASDFTNEEDFADRIILFFEERYPESFNNRQAREVLQAQANSIYKFYRLEDLSAWADDPGIEFAFNTLDNRTLDFMQDVDSFYLSKFVNNHDTNNRMHKFIQDQFLRKGQGLFGRTNDDAVNEFVELLRKEMKNAEGIAAKRILNTSVQRMRIWGHIGQLQQAGIPSAEIFNPSPEAPICKKLNGEIIQVGAAWQGVQRLANMTPREFEEWLHPVTPGFIEQKGLDNAVKEGDGFPPYHPECHTRLIAYSGDLSAAKMATHKNLLWLIKGGHTHE